MEKKGEFLIRIKCTCNHSKVTQIKKDMHTFCKKNIKISFTVLQNPSHQTLQVLDVIAPSFPNTMCFFSDNLAALAAQSLMD